MSIVSVSLICFLAGLITGFYIGYILGHDRGSTETEKILSAEVEKIINDL